MNLMIFSGDGDSNTFEGGGGGMMGGPQSMEELVAQALPGTSQMPAGVSGMLL